MNEKLINPYEGKFSAILLFGPPGVGKGTLGKFLASAGTQFHLASGEIFRRLPDYSVAGKLYQSYANKGLLLPDEATVQIWKYYVQGLIATNSYYPESQDLLLDGIPRTRGQADMMASYINVRHIIVLEIDNEEELIRRLLHRARLEKRGDELKLSVCKKRIEVYREQIHGVLDYYPKHLISLVDGEQKPLEVLRDVLMRLSHLLAHGPQNKHMERDDKTTLY